MEGTPQKRAHRFSRASARCRRFATEDHAALLGRMMAKVGRVAEAAGLSEGGYRLVVNDGADACQSVFHLHLHIIGGRELTWPPG